MLQHAAPSRGAGEADVPRGVRYAAARARRDELGAIAARALAIREAVDDNALALQQVVIKRDALQQMLRVRRANLKQRRRSLFTSDARHVVQ